MGRRANNEICKGMEGLWEEGDEVLEEDFDEDVMDAAIIAAAQKVEHYEICGYGTACAFAEELGESEAVDLLEDTLDEEKAANEKLTQIAETAVNRRAAAAKTSEKGERPKSQRQPSDRGSRSLREGAV
jgi:ferritin-like metal-binding protein YciE